MGMPLTMVPSARVGFTWHNGQGLAHSLIQNHLHSCGQSYGIWWMFKLYGWSYGIKLMFDKCWFIIVKEKLHIVVLENKFN
jgi:hypothetical protein